MYQYILLGHSVGFHVLEIQQRVHSHVDVYIVYNVYCYNVTMMFTGCLHCGAILNKAAINIYMQIFWWTYILFLNFLIEG